MLSILRLPYRYELGVDMNINQGTTWHIIITNLKLELDVDNLLQGIPAASYNIYYTSVTSTQK